MLGHGALLRFYLVIALVAMFTTFLIYDEDPYALGRIAVLGISYLSAIVLSVAWFTDSRTRGKYALLLLTATIVVLGGSYALSGGNGFPATNANNQTLLSCTTYTTLSNTTLSGSGFSCMPYSVPGQNIPLALGANLLVWVPIVGCILFSMPIWNGRRASKYANIERLLAGSVPAAAVLLNLIGIGFAGTLLSPLVLHLPLNPYAAFGMCDSVTAESGCVYVNQLYMLVDYVFWLAVVGLTSLVASGIYGSIESRRTKMIEDGMREVMSP